MTKSDKADAQSARVLGAALALGMTLGMVGAASAEPQNKSSEFLKLDSKDAAQGKIRGWDPQKKQAQTVKLQGTTAIKGQKTIKLDATTGQKVSATVTQKIPNSGH